MQKSLKMLLNKEENIINMMQSMRENGVDISKLFEKMTELDDVRSEIKDYFLKYIFELDTEKKN